MSGCRRVEFSLTVDEPACAASVEASLGEDFCTCIFTTSTCVCAYMHMYVHSFMWACTHTGDDDTARLREELMLSFRAFDCAGNLSGFYL